MSEKWKLRHNDYYYECGPESNGYLPINIFHRDSNDDPEDNRPSREDADRIAALCYAAPDLLEALEAILPRFIDLVSEKHMAASVAMKIPYETRPVQEGDDIKFALQAIAKAKGEKP